MDYKKVEAAVREGGSIRKAAKLLDKSYNQLLGWMTRNGYRIEKRATLVKVEREEE